MKFISILSLTLFSLFVLVACNPETLAGKVERIEYDFLKVENAPPYKSMGGSYDSWEEAYADGWKPDWTESGERYRTVNKPNGYVIVKLKDGKSIRCKNPFPNISHNQEVKIKETSSGDWVIVL